MAVRTVLTVPGTTEPQSPTGVPLGMLANVTQVLTPERFTCRQVDYPQAFFSPMSEVESMAVGVENLDSAVRTISGPVVLLGFSQGSQVLRRFLATTDTVVAAVGLIADPYRPLGVQQGPSLAGSGIAGTVAMWPEDIPVFEIAAADDAICNSAADSLLRPLAASLPFLSMTDPDTWMLTLLKNAAGVEWDCTPDDPPTPRRIAQATEDLLGFAVEGHHVQYRTSTFPGSPLTYCQYLATLISEASR